MIDFKPAGALMVALTVTVAPATPDNVPDEVTVGTGNTSSSLVQEEKTKETTVKTASNLNNLLFNCFILN